MELEVSLWEVLCAEGPWAWTYFRGLAEVGGVLELVSAGC